ncbi:hypothetical protein GWK47_036324 [Chionoecetes opilio]|uniref:Uncharacterized protein n=1 Tax=Chionoecetes opilio TaxID=41210 RepID=A0A8J4YMJ2_CHIOP|nr:hypothetical protein GWK47_036324 [Chionoecetes opilio]
MRLSPPKIFYMLQQGSPRLVLQACCYPFTDCTASSSKSPNTWTLVLSQETSSPKGFASSCSASRAITRTSSDSGPYGAPQFKTLSRVQSRASLHLNPALLLQADAKVLLLAPVTSTDSSFKGHLVADQGARDALAGTPVVASRVPEDSFSKGHLVTDPGARVALAGAPVVGSRVPEDSSSRGHLVGGPRCSGWCSRCGQ